jgi:hypothetical protein
MMKRKTLYAVVYTVVITVHIVMRLLWASLARGQLVKGDTNGERSRRLICFEKRQGAGRPPPPHPS